MNPSIDPAFGDVEDRGGGADTSVPSPASRFVRAWLARFERLSTPNDELVR